jgi:sporulation protein YlmC with PRC-barrel domain
MKDRAFAIAVAIATLVVLPVGVLAADSDAAKQPVKKTGRSLARSVDLVESSTLIGAKVEGTDGKDLGKIDQLLVNPQTGGARDAVVATGGVAGVGGKKVVVPWRALKIRNEDGKVVVRIDQAVLDRAPEYDKTALKRERNADRTAASPRTEPRDAARR